MHNSLQTHTLSHNLLFFPVACVSAALDCMDWFGLQGRFSESGVKGAPKWRAGSSLPVYPPKHTWHTHFSASLLPSSSFLLLLHFTVFGLNRITDRIFRTRANGHKWILYAFPFVSASLLWVLPLPAESYLPWNSFLYGNSVSNPGLLELQET